MITGIFLAVVGLVLAFNKNGIGLTNPNHKLTAKQARAIGWIFFASGILWLVRSLSFGNSLPVWDAAGLASNILLTVAIILLGYFMLFRKQKTN